MLWSEGRGWGPGQSTGPLLGEVSGAGGRARGAGSGRRVAVFLPRRLRRGLLRS